MPGGDKSAYTGKQKRQARHIEKGYEDRDLSEKEAERRAWATVNKQDGGGKKKAPSKSAKTNSRKQRTKQPSAVGRGV